MRKGQAEQDNDHGVCNMTRKMLELFNDRFADIENIEFLALATPRY